MPRIKRWFPVSQEINRDPQVWELCHLYGDRALRVWLEILSIADRADGALPNPSPELRRALANASRTSGQTVVKVWRTIQEWSWITSSEPLKVVNYWKYHKRREPTREPLREPTKSVSYPNLSDPILSKKNNKKKVGLPPDFQLDDSLLAWCRENQIQNPESLLEPFKDYHVSHGSKFISWPAAFRTWARNSQRFNNSTKTSQASPYPQPRSWIANTRQLERFDPKVKELISGLAKKIS